MSLGEDETVFHLFCLQAKSLFKKISAEADNLRNLWAVKLNLKGKMEMASTEDLRVYESIKEEVIHIILL